MGDEYRRQIAARATAINYTGHKEISELIEETSIGAASNRSQEADQRKTELRGTSVIGVVFTQSSMYTGIGRDHAEVHGAQTVSTSATGI